ncbi:ATP-binding cassette domain-containing protein [Xanthobacter sp. V2C-8]|uniref:ABC transporter ATP-binding protein n=1 Tax=Xanthobacter albus TaxID=3119929 RepID=UPI0037275903
MLISASGIVVRRGARTVLEGVELSARPGELLGLLGPNGAGKTTLLRVLAHLQETVAGTVLYDGADATSVGRRVLGRSLAYLAQGGRIHWPMRVEHVVALGRLPHGTSPAVDAAAVARAMAAADVDAFAGRPAGSLSGGEKMRVLLARALAVEGRALLADEPVAALDPYHQLHVMEVLRRQARAGLTVVVVLHDLTLAARFCDRVALLHGGRLMADGTPEEVMTPARLEAAYGVHVESGERHGERFILPWSRCPRTEDAPAR